MKSKEEIWQDWADKALTLSDTAYGAMEEYAAQFKQPNGKIDPKDCGVPNINFSIRSEGDCREPAWKKERLTQGFDETETWCLYKTIAMFILPRLIYYSTVCDRKGSKKKLDKMIFAFQKIVDGDIEGFEVEIKKGLKTFRKYYLALGF